MLCALTVRKLKPGSFDEFRTKFAPQEGDRPPEGWSAFHMLRSTSDENEVVTFGFFDGTLEEMERNQEQHGYGDIVGEVAPLVESVTVNGVYEFEVAVQAAGARG
jgi:heme-degrading monooxygenase HmoA